MQLSQVRPEHLHLLDQGGVAVVVGGKTTNFPEKYREHPRLRFFDSTDPASQRNIGSQIPINAKVIIGVRFNSHQVWTPLIEEARKRKLLLVNADGTGQAKDFIDRLLKIEDVPAASAPAATVVSEEPIGPQRPPPPKKTRAVLQWCWAHIEPRNLITMGDTEGGTPRKRIGGFMEECQRLFALAQAQNLPGNDGELKLDHIYASARFCLTEMGIEVGKPLPEWAGTPVTPLTPTTARTQNVLQGWLDREERRVEVATTQTAADAAKAIIGHVREQMEMAMLAMEVSIAELPKIQERLAYAITLEERVAEWERIKKALNGGDSNGNGNGDSSKAD